MSADRETIPPTGDLPVTGRAADPSDADEKVPRVPLSGSPALPGLPVVAADAATVEPGDVILAPHLPEPVRVWWRYESAEAVTVVLAGSANVAPQPVHLEHGAVVLVSGRGCLLGQDESAARVLAACRGGLWMVHIRHDAAPAPQDLQLLLDTHARMCGKEPQDALRMILDGMPRMHPS